MGFAISPCSMQLILQTSVKGEDRTVVYEDGDSVRRFVEINGGSTPVTMQKNHSFRFSWYLTFGSEEIN